MISKRVLMAMADESQTVRNARPTVSVKNFKSIRQARVELAPLTVLYGPNGSGKSTLIHALLTLRNLSLNPSQAVGAFFNYSFLNLGGFQAVVHDHDPKKSIELGLEWKGPRLKVGYSALFSETSGRLALSVQDWTEQEERFELNVSFPYPLNQQSKRDIVRDDSKFSVNWNGVTASATVASTGQAATDRANEFLNLANSVTAALKAITIAPPTRLFTEPQYAATSVSPWAVKQEEVAMVLSNDRYLVQKLSHYLERVVDRELRINSKPGAAFFTIDVSDRKTGLGSDVVNDGAGVNQVVYVLAKALSTESETVCVEEPEIHLHPTAVRRLAQVLVSIMRDEERRFVISTHSEPFLLALLGQVRSGDLKTEDLALYLVQKPRRETSFESQVVNDQGQVAGGLGTLIEGELEDVKAFLTSRVESTGRRDDGRL